MAEKAMTLRLPADLYQEMQVLARADGITVSAFVREALGVWIESRKNDPIFVQHARQVAAEWQKFADGLGNAS